MSLWTDLATAADITSLATTLFGPLPAAPPGVLHVTSAWRDETGELLTLRIRSDTPKSPNDRFALQLARARATTIVTSASILRTEKHLDYSAPGSPSTRAAFAAWRHGVVSGAERPAITILTLSGKVPADHGIFTGDHPIEVYCPSSVEAELRRTLPGAEIVAAARPTIRDALRKIRSRRPGTILIEAGPSLSGDLYEPPPAVDEIMLAVYLGAAVASSVRGGPIPDPASPASGLASEREATIVQEASGPWSFRRYTRISHPERP